MGGAQHFEAHADLYATARPPYPEALWDRLRELGLLRPGHRALDLGAGSGQASGRLLGEGLEVTAVEPGPRLAAQLRATQPDVRVLTAQAEDFGTLGLDPGSFELVVAATSIHWMDLDVVLPAVHRLLRPGGRLLVWRNVFGDPGRPTPFRSRVAEIVAGRDRPPRPGRAAAEDADATAAAVTRGGLFGLEDVQRYRWSVELDEQQVNRLFSTFSDWSTTEVEQAAAAVLDLGGQVTEHYQTWLLVLSPT